MVSKNKELRTLAMRAEKNSAQLNPLSMALNGVLDAAVQGGLANYETVRAMPFSADSERIVHSVLIANTLCIQC